VVAAFTTTVLNPDHPEYPGYPD